MITGVTKEQHAYQVQSVVDDGLCALREPEKLHFCRYGDVLAYKTTLASLAEEQEQHGMLLARAENSGCEGMYCEVARWNEKACQWQRYAFFKFLCEEHGFDAYSAAEFINASQRDASLVHTLPDFVE